MTTPDTAWFCNERFWHIAGEYEFKNSTQYTRADLCIRRDDPVIRHLVESAFREGHITGRCGGSFTDEDEHWTDSLAFASLQLLVSKNKPQTQSPTNLTVFSGGQPAHEAAGDLAESIKELIHSYADRLALAAVISALEIAKLEIFAEQQD